MHLGRSILLQVVHQNLQVMVCVRIYWSGYCWFLDCKDPGGVCSTICHHLCTLYVCVCDGRPACVVTQAEASRALAHLLSDKNTCESVLGRPHALPYLLHFSASIKPHDGIEV
jgi:hypothetical protein